MNKFSFYMVLPFVLAIIVDDKGRVLIGRHPKLDRKPYPGFWDLPGGKMEVGESPEDAIKREVREELSLETKGVSLFAVFHHAGETILPSCTSDIPGIGICFVLETEGELVSTEQDDVHFADWSELKSMKAEMTPWTAAFLDKYFGENGT